MAKYDYLYSDLYPRSDEDESPVKSYDRLWADLYPEEESKKYQYRFQSEQDTGPPIELMNPPEEQGFTDSLYNKAKGWGSAFGESSVGGAAQTIGSAVATAGETPLSMAFDPIGTLTSALEKKEFRSPYLSEQGRIFADTTRFDEADKRLKEAGIDPESFVGSASKAGGSVFPMGLAALTRSPGIGAGVLGASVFGPEYIEGTDEMGLSGPEAAERAAVQAAIETVTERIGFGAFFKGGLDNILTKGLKETLEKNYGTKLAGTIFANIGEELAATEAQMFADEEGGYRTYTPEQKAQNRMQAVAGAVVLGGGIGALTSLQKVDPAFEDGVKVAQEMAAQADAEFLGKEKADRDERMSLMLDDRAQQSDIMESIRKAQEGAKLAEASTITDMFSGEATQVKTPLEEEQRTPERQAELEREYLLQKQEELQKAKKAEKTVPKEAPKLWDLGVPEGASEIMGEAFRKAGIERTTDVRSENVYPNIREPVDQDTTQEDVFVPTRTPQVDQRAEQQGLPLKQEVGPRPSEVYEPTLTPEELNAQRQADIDKVSKDIENYQGKLKKSKTTQAKSKWTNEIARANRELESLTSLLPKGGTTNATTVRSPQGEVSDGRNAIEGSQGEGSENLQLQESGQPGVSGVRGEARVGTEGRQARESTQEDVDGEAPASPEVVASLKQQLSQRQEEAQSVDVQTRRTDVRRALIGDKDIPDSSITILDDDNSDTEAPKGFDKETDRGAYDPSTGKLYVNSKTVKPEDAVAVALHEIAHDYDVNGKKTGKASVDRLIGEENRNRITKVVDILAEQGVAPAKRAQERAKASGDQREYLTYLIEEVRLARDSGKSIPRRVMNVIKDIIASMKGYLIDKFGEGKIPFTERITEADILRMSSIMAKGYTPTKQGKGEVLKSRAAPAKREEKVTGEPAKETRRTEAEVVGDRGSQLDGIVPGTGKKPRASVGKSDTSLKARTRRASEAFKNSLSSLEGKPIEMVALQETQEGLHNLAALEAKQAGNRLSSALFSDIPQNKRKEAIRLISLASSENSIERDKARTQLRDMSENVYNKYMDMRNKIQLFGLEIAQSIIYSGRPLTNRDVAVVKKIMNSGDFYLTRAYKMFAKSSRVRDQWRKFVMDGVREFYKTGKANEGSDIFNNAVESLMSNHLDITNFLGDEKTSDSAKMSGFRSMDLAEVNALANIWLGDKAPRFEMGMDPDQKDAYLENVKNALGAKRDSLGNEEYLRQLSEKGALAAKTLIGEVGGKEGGTFANLVEAISKDTTILQKKQQVNPNIRKLLGEVINPIAQLEQTLMLQAEYLASADMQQQLYDTALKNGWIKDTPDSKTHTESISQDTMKYGPLAGMWATQDFKNKFDPLIEIQASFREALTRGDPVQGILNEAVDLVGKGTALAKMITVAYNPWNIAFNFLGGAAVTPIQNGYAVFSPTKSNVSALKNAFSAVYSSLTPENRKGMSKAYKQILGVGLQDAIEVAETQQATRESLRNQILDDIARDITSNKQRLIGGLSEGASVLFKKLPVWATAESDRVWVYYAYFKEMDMLRSYYKAKGQEVSDKAISSQAAERVKRANINPSRQAKLVRGLEKYGVTQFMNYFLETYKSIGRGYAVALNDLVQAKKDLNEGYTKAAAIRSSNAALRLTGLSTAVFANRFTMRTLAAGLGFGALLSAAGGDDEYEKKVREYQETIEALKKSLPLDEQGKEWIIIGQDKDTYYIQDVNRFDPLEPATAPITSLMEGNLERAIEQTGSLVFTNSFAAGLLSAVSEPNKKVGWAYTHPKAYASAKTFVTDLAGRYAPEVGEVFDGVLKVVKPLTPRVAITHLDKMAGGEIAGGDVVRLMKNTGAYVFEYTPTTAVYRAAKGTKDEDGYVTIRKELKDSFVALSENSPETIEKVASRLIQQEREAFNRMVEVYTSSRQVASNKNAVDAELKKTINNNSIVNSIKQNKFTSKLWSEQSKNNLISNIKKDNRIKTEEDRKKKVEDIENLWKIYKAQQ